MNKLILALITLLVLTNVSVIAQEKNIKKVSDNNQFESSSNIIIVKPEDGFVTDIELFDIEENIIKKEISTYERCWDADAKSAFKLLHFNGLYRVLNYQFTEANWSNVKKTCGNGKPSGPGWTVPFSNFNQYQMVILERGNNTDTWYQPCQEGVVYSLKLKQNHLIQMYLLCQY